MGFCSNSPAIPIQNRHRRWRGDRPTRRVGDEADFHGGRLVIGQNSRLAWHVRWQLSIGQQPPAGRAPLPAPCEAKRPSFVEGVVLLAKQQMDVVGRSSFLIAGQQSGGCLIDAYHCIINTCCDPSEDRLRREPRHETWRHQVNLLNKKLLPPHFNLIRIIY
jgi:hypothetical protein